MLMSFIEGSLSIVKIFIKFYSDVRAIFTNSIKIKLLPNLTYNLQSSKSYTKVLY